MVRGCQNPGSPLPISACSRGCCRPGTHQQRVVADHRADPGQRDLSAPGGAGHRLPRGLTTLAAPDSMRVLSFQILEPTMYVLITGSGVIFRKQIRVSPRRWDS